MAIEIVSFPINSMVDFSIVMLVYQRVNHYLSWFISPKLGFIGVISVVNGDYKPTNITRGAPFAINHYHRRSRSQKTSPRRASKKATELWSLGSSKPPITLRAALPVFRCLVVLQKADENGRENVVWTRNKMEKWRFNSLKTGIYTSKTINKCNIGIKSAEMMVFHHQNICILDQQNGGVLPQKNRCVYRLPSKGRSVIFHK